MVFVFAELLLIKAAPSITGHLSWTAHGSLKSHMPQSTEKTEENQREKEGSRDAQDQILCMGAALLG